MSHPRASSWVFVIFIFQCGCGRGTRRVALQLLFDIDNPSKPPFEKGGFGVPSPHHRINKKQATTGWLSLAFEPKPRFELGTPSLRVKCSTAELFRPFGTRVPVSVCKYPKKF